MRQALQLVAGLAALAIAPIAGAQGTPSDGAADLIVRNARVTTLDDARPEAAAFAVRGEKFVAVGGEEEVDAPARRPHPRRRRRRPARHSRA